MRTQSSPLGGLFLSNEEYKKKIDRYTGIDGVKALGLYLIFMAVAFFHGYILTTDLSVGILNLSGIVLSVIDIMIGIGFVFVFKDTLSSIGFIKKNLRKSLLLGIAGTVLIMTVYISVYLFGYGENLTFYPASLMFVCIFLFGAISEEIVFRGYISARLCGLVKNQGIASLISALLFVSIHYPVRWVTTGAFSLTSLSLEHVIYLIILHFLCDWVYKKTNSLWGSILLHFLYNILASSINFN